MKKRLLVIDTETGFLDRFRYRLEVEDISDKYEIVNLKPVTTIGRDEMAQMVVENATTIVTESDVTAIFVDLVIYEGAKFDTDGILIIRLLREALPAMPLFTISGKSNESELVHMDHFAEATLGDADGVFPKSFLEGETFSAKRLSFLLKRGQEKRAAALGSLRAQESRIKDGDAPLPQKTVDALGAQIDPRIGAQIEELGRNAFWNVVTELLPGASGALSYVAPGASGAYVLRAHVKFERPGPTFTGAKQFLVKVAKGENALDKEASNRTELAMMPVSRMHFPTLLREEPSRAGGLSAIAYEFETEHETLESYLARAIPENAPETVGLVSKLGGILGGLYGDPKLEVRTLWGGSFQLDAVAQTKLLGYLAENKRLLDELCSSKHRMQVEAFLRNDGLVARSLEREIDTRYIHGDLNCGNVLVRARKGEEVKISIIDLASRRQENVVTDFAKLERDIVFRIFDSASPNFHAPNRIQVWRSFLATLHNDAIFEMPRPPENFDGAIRRAFEVIYELRSSLKRIDSRSNIQSYQVALLFFALLSILHPRTSVAKKAFAVEYAATLVEQLDEN